MISKFKISIVLGALLAFVFAMPAFAGGWAVITLDELPADLIAGEPFTVGFTVLQHGRTPMADLDPTILAESKGEKFIAHAKPEGKPGHYVATLMFPSKGKWEWIIKAFTMEQKMPVLSVDARAGTSASARVEKTQPVASLSVSPMLILRGVALTVGLVGLFFALQRKSRLAVALTALCFMVGVGSFVVGSAVPAVEAESDTPVKVAGDETISQVDLGQQLFIAKGCITCHANTKVANSYEYWTIEVTGATSLSNFSASPEILRIRLKEPKEAKSDTQMPNLGLSDSEIEALIAFINSQ